MCNKCDACSGDMENKIKSRVQKITQTVHTDRALATVWSNFCFFFLLRERPGDFESERGSVVDYAA